VDRCNNDNWNQRKNCHAADVVGMETKVCCLYPIITHFTLFLWMKMECGLYAVVSALLDKGAEHRPLEVLPVLHKGN